MFYPAVFEGGGICSEYDYLEKYGIKDIAKEIDCGTCSDEYASNLCGSITFLTEMPYFYDSRIDDRSESDLTRADALKQKIAWTMASNQKLKDALAISEDCMGDHNPFRDSVVCFMKSGSYEAELKMADEKPECRFANRCPYACDKCRSEQPPLQDLGDGHWISCHREATAV